MTIYWEGRRGTRYWRALFEKIFVAVIVIPNNENSVLANAWCYEELGQCAYASNYAEIRVGYPEAVWDWGKEGDSIVYGFASATTAVEFKMRFG